MTSCTSSSRSTVNDALGRGRELRGDPISVGHLPDPLAHPPGDLDPSELVAHDVLGQELLADEVAEAVADLVLLAREIAVCGIGRPSGRRKSAVTANQSASAPTIAASAVART